jgi:hypothetical protein
MRARREPGPFFMGLPSHGLPLGDDELVFLFEGEHAEQEARRLLREPACLVGPAGSECTCWERPRLPEEEFSWERPPHLNGVSFGPQPGPGDSEGGLTE